MERRVAFLYSYVALVKQLTLSGPKVKLGRYMARHLLAGISNSPQISIRHLPDVGLQDQVLGRGLVYVT
jgi:hypothetical protein